MAHPARTPPPEAAGPAVESSGGTPVYGVPGPAATFPEDHRPLPEPVRNPRCSRCMDLPDDVVASVAAALRTAARDGRLR